MKKLLCVLIMMSVAFIINAQDVHVNREWFSYTGDPVFNPILNPFGLEWTKSIPSPNGGIFTVAHTNVSGQGENILVTYYDDYGAIIWQDDYNTGGTNNDYGIDIVEDANGNVFVCGTTDNGGSTNYDVVILKYNSTGSLVATATYTGSAGLNDIGTAMMVDGSGNLYLAATNENSSTSYDYLAIKMTNSLSVIWTNTYDYASLIDVPVGLTRRGGQVLVAGASANTLTDWDYAVVAFDETTGSYIGHARNNIPGVGYDQPFGFVKDASGNTYVTGRASTNGINYDIRTMKIDNANNIVWTQTFDGAGLEDVGNSIAVDGSGNVIVGGFTTKANNVKDMIVLKYNSSGTLQWADTQTSKDATADAFIKKIVLNTNDEIYYIGGEKGIGANKQGIVGKIKPYGKKSWERSIKGAYDYIPSDIQFGGGGTPGVYTIAIKDSTINVYETAFYTDFERDTARAFTVSGKPFYKKHEFIIRFNPTSIDTTKINNRDITFGNLSDFLTVPSYTALADIVREDLSDVKAFKIFPKLTSHNMHSISRTGATVDLLPLYATLGVVLPSSINDTTTAKNLQNAYSILQAVDLNYFVELHNANDVDYVNGNSAGLDATVTYSLSSINASPAWSVEVGNPNIKVGVFDTGINPNHTDFGSGKISDGFDYYNTLPYLSSQPVDKLGHGSGIAGTIGAIRNNSVGVAGIAGGDATLGNTGVSLHDMKCFEGNDNGGAASNFSAGLDKIENAMIDGALTSSTANIGQGEHAQNHSWGMASDFAPNFTVLKTLRDVMTTVFENECLMSFSSGNRENIAFTTGIYSKNANFKDQFNLCVGGIDGTGGRWATLTHGGSNGGAYLDFVAPAHPDLYNLIAKNTNTTTDYLVWNSATPSPSTNLADGTSFANPYATGVAALMMSYVNNHAQKPNNIAPEDIEKMMEKCATDMTVSPFGGGWDPQSGYGRINAGETMDKIKLPQYLLKHININTTLASCTASQNSTLQSIYFPQTWNGFGPGLGLVNRYKVTYISNHSVGTYSVLDAWKRDAQSNLLNIVDVPTTPGASNTQTNYIPNDVDIDLNSYTSTQAFCVGYTYEIMMWNGSAYVPSGFWYPMDLTSTNPVKFAYTLYLYDATAGIKKERTDVAGIYVYPNPANDKIIIHYDADQPKKTEVRIMDVMGRLLYQEDINFNRNDNEHELSTVNLINGIYFVTLEIDKGKTQTFKQIVSH